MKKHNEEKQSELFKILNFNTPCMDLSAIQIFTYKIGTTQLNQKTKKTDTNQHQMPQMFNLYFQKGI